MTEQAIRLCAQLYERRDDLKTIFGDRYAKEIENARKYVEREQREKNLDALEASISAAKKYNGWLGQFILVAALEMSEGVKADV